ncbi:hypothetical protein INT47_006279 [Mucor saturninus]|uniref:Uncharacterized protein n=1 Tax=Mucor saturninus TaxID=64648 RepID=A0A8H7V8J0_9FUNG|nr:hypothetical protein INT47_006279 [Mucor saturninus]
MEEILTFIKKYTHLFDRQRVNDLGKWLKASKIHLVDSPIKRVYLSDALKNVVSYLDKYQTYIKSLKKDGHSIIGYARDKLSARDKKQDIELENGNTQDMLNFLKNQEKVCLVVIDFAGLSTNSEDLRQFVSDNESLQKIIVDTLPFNNKVTIFDRASILGASQANGGRQKFVETFTKNG